MTENERAKTTLNSFLFDSNYQKFTPRHWAFNSIRNLKFYDLPENFQLDSKFQDFMI